MSSTDALIKQCIRGNRKAFGTLVENHYDYTFRVAFRMLANEEEARDITQEVFIKVWKNMSSFNAQSKFTTWLYSIVSNLCIDNLRKRKNHSDVEIELALEKIIDHEGDNYDRKDLAAIIRLIANELSPKQHAIFVLRDLEGLEMAEIAEVTGLSPANVKSNLWHARRTIRDKLIHEYKVNY
jgi:RNA polymerase sigma-70 factor (ECF subfamily)